MTVRRITITGTDTHGQKVSREVSYEVTAPPPTTGWRDATNTGVPPGTQLTVRNNDLTVNTAGQVIENLDIRANVTLNANNVTLRRCKITNSNFYTVFIHWSKSGCVVEDCTIDGKSASGSIGINGPGNFRRNNIYRVENGVGGHWDSVIEDNFIHDLLGTGSPHYDGIQCDGGNRNIIIRHNSILVDHNQTSAVMIDNWAGPVDNILVENNVLVGGGYTVYCDAQFNNEPITNVRFINNHMGTGGFGITNFNGTNPVYTGNVNDGAAIAQTLVRWV